MSGKTQHVVPTGGDWGIRGEGNSKLTAVFDTQAKAYEAAQTIAQNQRAELVLHGQNGRIRAKESYGNDPSSIVDREH